MTYDDGSVEKESNGFSKTFFIAGVQHHKMHTCLHLLSKGLDLKLWPEPDNKFDPNAIKIEVGGAMLGYVPKKFSSELSAMLEIVDLTCTIVELNKEAKPWEMCKVEIKEVE